MIQDQPRQSRPIALGLVRSGLRTLVVLGVLWFGPGVPTHADTSGGCASPVYIDSQCGLGFTCGCLTPGAFSACSEAQSCWLPFCFTGDICPGLIS
jgi:hypothetical protein